MLKRVGGVEDKGQKSIDSSRMGASRGDGRTRSERQGDIWKMKGLGGEEGVVRRIERWGRAG